MRIQTTLFIAVAGIAGLSSVALTFSADPPASSTKRTQKTDEEPSAKDANKWMEIKLHSSQEIFAALSRGDAKGIETPARRMLLLNVLEQWKSNKPYMDHSQYEGQLNAFEYAVKELARTGRDNNINDALDAYVALTKSCVRCHQIVRDSAPKK
jgi:hypothetical protein